MTITIDRNALHMVEDRRRARALRWLLITVGDSNVPMPERIEFGHFVDAHGETLRYLTLDLDDDADVTGWAHILHADIEQLDVVGGTDRWILVTAHTTWSDDPHADWHRISVATRRDRRPIPAESAGR